MDLDLSKVFDEASGDSKPSEAITDPTKIEEALKDTTDAKITTLEELTNKDNAIINELGKVKTALENTIEDIKGANAAKASEIARLKMIEQMGDRDESHIPLSDTYWKLKTAFHEALHNEK